ncbi:serine/threonine-protein kinase [Kitasatospora sp. NPDC096140]|uniref:serine/threonine-protein kinase n=1 Tax=Kitasatospora sp. NPDC096140 TaxID=3155425 RepID=UPI00331A5F7F
MKSGELVAGRYELTRRLGRGGMGEVWSARDRTLHRDVALKTLVLDAATVAELPLRFEREAVAVAQINHPNVVAVYDRGMHEDVVFLVMEQVDGGNLAELVRARGTLDLVLGLDIAEAVCAALAAAHRARIIHYDIKPQNVMLTRGGRVKVVDFGIAGLSLTVSALARSSELSPAGTPEYGAPEQFLTERGDERSDLYALGGVLFAVFAGRPPFSGHNALAIVRRKLDEPAPRLDTVRPGLPRPLVDLVADLLERDPARRPQTAQEVHGRLRALRVAAGSGTTPAPPPRGPGHPNAPGRPDGSDRPGPPRRPLAVPMGILVALGLFVGAGYLGYQWTQDQYYVGVDGDHVAVYQGVNQSLAGLSLSSVHDSYGGIQLKWLPQDQRAHVNSTISFGSLKDAQSTVQELDAWVRLCQKATGVSRQGSPLAFPTAFPTAAADEGPDLTDEERSRAESCPRP